MFTTTVLNFQIFMSFMVRTTKISQLKLKEKKITIRDILNDFSNCIRDSGFYYFPETILSKGFIISNSYYFND